MKQILVASLLFIGFFVASCEEEHHERRYGYHHERYGHRPPYEHREYRGYHDGYYGPGYRFLDETVQNGVASQVETTVEP